MKNTLLFGLCLFLTETIHAQSKDTTKDERFSFHYQTTVINQNKLTFKANYSGDNSLIKNKENKTSLTSSLYLGARLWKGASLYLNPEIAGGSGLSSALGIGAATNGETFRVGSPEPKIYLARLFYKQVISLSKETNYQESDFNQIAMQTPKRYMSVIIGKIGVADFFDDNKFSHDPKTQFMSWALMDNGAWDYPANTRGYTPSVVLEYVTPKDEIRYDISMVPETANGNTMNKNISKANSQTIEYTHRINVKNQPGAIRLLAFYTTTNMGNYNKSTAFNPINPEISKTRSYGNSKYGFAINAEQNICNNLGFFFRASWNDGNNETWMFTEIDRSISGGFSLNGKEWKRPNDNIGVAFVASGLSEPHRNYLKAGGKGFMLGDGNLNYTTEKLTEIYYSAELVKNNIFISGAYQFLMNPGYNKDRKGPVHIFSIRVHARI